MAYKQITHDIKVSFVDASSTVQTVINNLTQQYVISNPTAYNSSRITLIGTTQFKIDDINFLYMSCEKQISVFINVTNQLIVQHLSYINLLGTFDIILSNVSGQLNSEVQLFYGAVT
jgi:hypothetical protein